MNELIHSGRVGGKFCVSLLSAYYEVVCVRFAAFRVDVVLFGVERYSVKVSFVNKPLPFGIVQYGLSAPFLVHIPVAHIVNERQPAFTPECVYAMGKPVDLRELTPGYVAFDVLHATFASFPVAGIVVIVSPLKKR